MISLELILCKLFVSWLKYLDSKLSIALYNQLNSESESDTYVESTIDKIITSSCQSPIGILEENKKKWKEINKNNLFSTYRSFCNFCADDLYFTLKIFLGIYETDQNVFTNILYLICQFSCHVLFIGQFFTNVGRGGWYIIVRKYFLFITIALGIWTDECYQSFNFDTTMYFNENRKYQKNDCDQYLRAIISPRAVLLQLFSPLTILSTYSVFTCGYPIGIYSKDLKDKLNPLFIKDSLSIQLSREQENSGSDLSAAERSVLWTVYLKSYSVYWFESRAIQYFHRFFSFVAVIGIIYYPLAFIFLSLIVFFPYILFAYVDIMVLIGKQINLQDEDLKIILGSKYFKSETSTIYVIHGQEEDSNQISNRQPEQPNF